MIPGAPYDLDWRSTAVVLLAQVAPVILLALAGAGLVVLGRHLSRSK